MKFALMEQARERAPTAASLRRREQVTSDATRRLWEVPRAIRVAARAESARSCLGVVVSRVTIGTGRVLRFGMQTGKRSGLVAAGARRRMTRTALAVGSVAARATLGELAVR